MPVLSSAIGTAAPKVELGADTVSAVPSDSYWRSLFLFNGYRFIVSLLLLSVTAIFGRQLTFGSLEFELFVYTAATYVMFSLLCFLAIASRRLFHVQLGIQVGADIIFIVVLMFASGGISSGLGLLLLSGLAAAGLISRGRLTLFYAALASIAVLIEQTFQVWLSNAQTTQYVQAGLLSIGYFTTAWVAHTLAKYLVETEQLVAQREIDLASMSEVSQLVIKDMQDGVLVVDAQGLIRQHNARAEEMLGSLHDERRERHLSAYAPALAYRLQEWRKNPIVGFNPLSTVVQNNKISARFVPVGRSRNVGAVIFLEDMTRVQAQARQLKLAALGRLTANIAHEVRNPLSAISHATELLQEEPALNETVARLLMIIHDNTKRLDRMVNDVLKLNRGERAHREVFRVGDYLKTFAEQFCQIEKVPATAIALELAVDSEVTFDRSHLNQVMWNLCRNALRHCRGGPGSIRIAVDLIGRGDIVKLDVVDDGPGVPIALRSQLFEPFFTTVSSGTGLGLYIAREVCEANDAKLEFIETPAGAQFTVMCQRGVKANA
ncbi:MAG: integral rane sensor signal transduction histidine kinase [Betaproteobacteria bacterium]|nr:integral rane sensor signal transduction histidine kinase [Betaproteobacteria bacterium]